MVAFFALLSVGSAAFAQEGDNDMVRVYRWLSTVDNNYVTLAEGEIQEGQLLQYKYKEKTFLFYAYRTPGPDRVAIYRWTNPVTKDQTSIAEDEFTDDQMLKMGYSDKHLQFYAPTRRAANQVSVYRWFGVE